MHPFCASFSPAKVLRVHSFPHGRRTRSGGESARCAPVAHRFLEKGRPHDCAPSLPVKACPHRAFCFSPSKVPVLRRWRCPLSGNFLGIFWESFFFFSRANPKEGVPLLRASRVKPSTRESGGQGLNNKRGS